MNTKQTSIIVYGAALIAACSGKLVVDDATNGVGSAGGAGGAAGSGNGDAGPSPSGGHAGGSFGGSGGNDVGGAGGGAGGIGAGGVGAGGIEAGGVAGSGDWPGAGGLITGGSAGCFSGPEPASGGYPGTGGQGAGGIGSDPKCPLDADGLATVDLTTICEGGVEWANGSPYPCPASSADLTKGLACDEVTTEHTGFTKTVGCGFETIEFHSYEMRTTYNLEHEYAASYDATGALSGLVVKEPAQFGPCLSYAYKAGTLPPDCPSAVTYKCTRIPQGNASDAAYEGCRSPDEPGCGQCCNSDPVPDSCTVWTPANGSSIYENGSGQNHACRCDCKPCAKCKLEDERNIRLVIPHPECNCSLPPTGACGNWCNNFLPYKNNLCPGL